MRNAVCGVRNKVAGCQESGAGFDGAMPYHPCFILDEIGRARSTTAPCGRCRECELAQWSKLCEVNNEHTNLGTTSGGGTAQRWVVLFKLQVANGKWQISERYALDYTSGKLQVANGKFRNCVGDYRLSRKLKM